ncbi:hypothetical protein BH11MYX2_BH11MYX2_09660 [soil metagenome]
MLSSLPQARVVRAQGQLVAPPPRPPEPPTAFQSAMRENLELLVGMWPLFAVLALAMGFLYLVAMSGSP